MKRSLLALAALTALSGVAYAQSSVTLSGGVDLAIRRVGTATGNDWNMATSGSSRSNFTLSGTEDLGGGMKAMFLMNHRFAPNTGSTNVAGNCVAAATPAANCLTTNQTYFWRNSWVGLSGGFGDVRLGRILAPLQDLNGSFDPWGTDTVGSIHSGGVNATVRATNSIYYRTPNMGGLQGHAMIAAGEGQIPAEQGGLRGKPYNAERPMGAGVVYAAGPLRAALMYDRNSADQKTVGVYGSYNAGFATVMGQYEKGDKNVSDASNANTEVARWSLSAAMPFGAAVAKVGYTKWSDENIKKFGLGLDYNLSKRTTLYTNMGKVSGTGATTAASKAQFDAGIWHRF